MENHQTSATAKRPRICRSPSRTVEFLQEQEKTRVFLLISSHPVDPKTTELAPPQKYRAFVDSSRTVDLVQKQEKTRVAFCFISSHAVDPKTTELAPPPKDRALVDPSRPGLFRPIGDDSFEFLVVVVLVVVVVAFVMDVDVVVVVVVVVVVLATDQRRGTYVGLVGGVLSLVALLAGGVLAAAVVYLRRRRAHLKHHLPQMPRGRNLLPRQARDCSRFLHLFFFLLFDCIHFYRVFLIVSSAIKYAILFHCPYFCFESAKLAFF